MRTLLLAVSALGMLVAYLATIEPVDREIIFTHYFNNPGGDRRLPAPRTLVVIGATTMFLCCVLLYLLRSRYLEGLAVLQLFKGLPGAEKGLLLPVVRKCIEDAGAYQRLHAMLGLAYPAGSDEVGATVEYQVARLLALDQTMVHLRTMLGVGQGEDVTVALASLLGAKTGKPSDT